jgi:branched-subunit amino acid ABC-type transport system permease component
MDITTERIQYLTKKAQRGVISTTERDELARLLGHNPHEFQGPDGLTILIAIALAAIAAAIIIAILSSSQN